VIQRNFGLLQGVIPLSHNRYNMHSSHARGNGTRGSVSFSVQFVLE